MRLSPILRQVAQTAYAVRNAKIPEPRAGAIKTPSDFLGAIGRASEKKLSSSLSKWQKWEDMWATTGEVLKDSGVGVKDRRYFLWCLEKYRQGGDPSKFAISEKPKKKYRGWGPKVQNGKRIR